jgi:hypothetical protein
LPPNSVEEVADDVPHDDVKYGCCHDNPTGIPTTADTAAELGPDTVQRIVDKLGSRKTAQLAKELGGAADAALTDTAGWCLSV